MKKTKSLLLCATPLQLLIAEQIIQLHPENTYDLILLVGSNENIAKYTYYYDRISKLCENTLFWHNNRGIKNIIRFKMNVYMKGFNKKYSKIYLANIEKRLFQLLISSNSTAKIYTFDDGLANIIPSSKLYQKSTPNLGYKFIWKAFDVNNFMQDIKKKILVHYTIYEGLPNISPNTKIIKLFDIPSSDKSPIQTNTIRIYLGQPLLELNEKFTLSYITKILSELNIDYYFPHPRESDLTHIKNMLIETNLILEDYIIEYVKKNPSTKIELYSFLSGALLNLAEIPNVESNFIYDDYVKKNHSYLYKIIKSHSNLRLIHLKNKVK